ncbi:MAG: helix-turn-helix domain-containing protein [Lachnospiraceae bacterium]|nr:helix-turn-helix domain-containing protein [Lachnospiraceae bacterium]
MAYQAALAFTQNYLTSLHISSCLLSDVDNVIPTTIDLGLRSFLFDTDNYATILENSFTDAKDRTIYRFFDEYDCKYIFMRLPDESYFFIGPYLVEIPTQSYLEARGHQLALSSTKQQQLALYYTNLPVIEDENWLLTLANTLGSTIWTSCDTFNLEYVEYEIRDRSVPIPISVSEQSTYDTPLALSLIEDNYKNEKLLMDAVSKGRLHLVTTVAASVFNKGTGARSPATLRNRKNDLIILKTLLRKAAEYGGVHPLHIHRLSSAYAQHIENVRTIKESLRLQEDMIRGYCLLVKNHSLSRYSYYVGKAITLIHYDLTTDLSLNTIALALNVNSSYLSKLFRKECDCTLTDYVHRQRVEHATLLLRDATKTVQNIATECGFQDVTHFIRVFKKHFGVTPAVYREQRHEKA